MEKYMPQMTEALQKLISFNSVAAKKAHGAPYGREINSALLYALSLCGSLGFRVKNLDNRCGYAEIGEGEVFGVLCHLDVVPFNASDWKYPPLGGRVADGKLYGRGALDDKGPTIAAVFAVKALIDKGFVFKKRVRFIFGLDEETGEWDSLRYYMEKEGMPSVGIAPDADFPVINSEKGKVDLLLKARCKPDCHVKAFFAGQRSNIVPDSAYMIVAYDKNITDAANAAGFRVEQTQFDKKDGFVKISTLGKAAHGAHPEQGENAAVKLLKLLYALNIQPYARIYTAIFDFNGKGLSIEFEDAISGKLTINAGIFKTSKAGGVIGVELDIRHPHNVSKDELLDIVRNKNPLFAFKLLAFHRPLFVPKDDPLVKTLLNAYNKITGENAKPLSIGGATFARALNYGVAFGPVFPNSVSTVHEADEYISISDFLQTARIYHEAFKNLL
ncbi:MAG: Sapep family Mn(2+)-dependent dipeptidase [Clostridiales bacterium]|jgi:succinyl-diaminopimelate desuccinylase|nr:Sapep family Mn(2+)-dependent dipeptidase [Clostridiales bacterium]